MLTQGLHEQDVHERGHLITKGAIFQARKRNPNPNFLVRISSGGVGVCHVKGWGPKSSVCPSKPRKTKLFGGISRDFAGIFQGRPKSLRKKKLVFNLRPLNFQPSYRRGQVDNPPFNLLRHHSPSPLKRMPQAHQPSPSYP